MRRVIRELRDRLVRRLLLAADRLAAEAEAQARARRDGVSIDVAKYWEKVWHEMAQKRGGHLHIPGVDVWKN